MPDFTLETYAQCKSASFFMAEVGGYEQTLGGERHWPYCTCPAFKFRKTGSTRFGGRQVPKPCKHIVEAEKLRCGWHEAHSDEVQTEKGVCPRCGGPTEYIQMAV